jgi:hypothetical protein
MSQDDAKPADERTERARAGTGKYVEQMDTAERDAEAFRMRSRSRTLREIADALGYYDTSHVSRALKRAAERVTLPALEEYRKHEDAKLDVLERKAVEILEAQHLRIRDGEVVTFNGEPVTDAGPLLGALRELRGLMDRRAKLHGLDAPVKADFGGSVTVHYTVAGVDMDKV